VIGNGSLGGVHADKKSANNKNPYTRFPLIVVCSISRRNCGAS
jgi:hypothetical protein